MLIKGFLKGRVVFHGQELKWLVSDGMNWRINRINKNYFEL